MSATGRFLTMLTLAGVATGIFYTSVVIASVPLGVVSLIPGIAATVLFFQDL